MPRGENEMAKKKKIKWKMAANWHAGTHFCIAIERLTDGFTAKWLTKFGIMKHERITDHVKALICQK